MAALLATTSSHAMLGKAKALPRSAFVQDVTFKRRMSA
jgi:hypothetical protein